MEERAVRQLHIRGAYHKAYDSDDEDDDQMFGGIFELSKDLIRRLSIKIIDGRVVLPDAVEKCFMSNAELEVRKGKDYSDDARYVGKDSPSTEVGIVPWNDKIIVRVLYNYIWSDDPSATEYEKAVDAGIALNKCADSIGRIEYISAQNVEAEKGLPPGVVASFLGKKPRSNRARIAQKRGFETRRNKIDKIISEQPEEDEMPGLIRDPDIPPVKKEGGRRKHKRGTRRRK